jgi:hypothetical protein
MSRRLEEATEDALLTGGRAGRRAVEDAGFSDELKERLLDKIADAQFRKQYAGAFAEAQLPTSAGEGTRHMAGAEPWTGQESTADGVLRMLDDARKPLRPELRGTFKVPGPVDMRIKKKPAMKAGQRIASAKDAAAAYAVLGTSSGSNPVSQTQAQGLSDAEKEEMKRGFRERFEPGARAMPNTITGLAALANERIENAIARGQFKNIPRGVGVERDARADNPFIDTTEYLMNKMIQRQDLVPPWIEKQQDIARAVHSFRTRLRNDWKRHAARTLAAQGGSLAEQMRRAEAYAAAERAHNPRRRSVEDLPVSTSLTDDIVMVKMRQQAQQARDDKAETASSTQSEDDSIDAPLPRPFRDPSWERTEKAYMELSIKSLNDETRSYNLMAPDLAKKPYFSLQRELDACFADVAPRLAHEIKERSLRPPPRHGSGGGGTSVKPGLLEQLAGDSGVRVHLESEDKAYGLKEWWRDVWKKT